MTDITVTELLQELNKAQKLSDNIDGFSSEEWCKAIGRSRSRGREKLKIAVNGGYVKHVGFRTTTAIDGRVAHAPVYQLTGKKK